MGANYGLAVVCESAELEFVFATVALQSAQLISACQTEQSWFSETKSAAVAESVAANHDLEITWIKLQAAVYRKFGSFKV